MKRSIRWSLLMAILGFILGLGFLIPIPANETREPASDLNSTPPEAVFLAPSLKPGRATLSLPEERFPKTLPSFDSGAASTVDRRKDRLFDIHTISKSRYARDTDAYVVTWFRDGYSRDEIASFTYCHNYDYSQNRAQTDLDRFATAQSNPGKEFPCYTISLDELKKGTNLINTIFGPVLTLKSNDFDPYKGGTLSVIFAYHIAKIGQNDYRTANLKVTLNKGKLSVTGPRGEYFDWLNLVMSEDLIGFPNGVKGFEFFAKGSTVAKYHGKATVFSKTSRPTNH